MTSRSNGASPGRQSMLPTDFDGHGILILVNGTHDHCYCKAPLVRFILVGSSSTSASVQGSGLRVESSMQEPQGQHNEHAS